MFWQRMNVLGFDQFIFPDWYMSKIVIAYYDLKKETERELYHFAPCQTLFQTSVLFPQTAVNPLSIPQVF